MKDHGISDGKSPSQICLGLACVGVGFLAIYIIFFAHTDGYPSHLMPPTEGFYLRHVWMALFEYANEHDSQYPKDLQSITDSFFLLNTVPKRTAFLSSPNLRYFPPAEPIQDPYTQKNKDRILLSYETDKWCFSISIGNELKYARKKTTD